MRRPNWIQHVLITPAALVLFISIQACSATSGQTAGDATAAAKAENEITDIPDVVDVPRQPGENEQVPPANGGGENEPPPVVVGGEENEPPSTPNELDIIRDVIDRNEACSVDSPAIDAQGKNYTFNGVQAEVSVGNGAAITINGVTQKLSVMGADTARVNGAHAQVCVQANQILLNGSYGKSGVPTVLQGQGADSRVNAVNGNHGSDLAIVGIDHIAAINGTGGDIYVYGGEVEVINGNARDVYVMNGAVVKRVNGNFAHVYVFSGSSVRQSNGNVNITPR